MAVVIRLRQQGKNNRQSYRVVATDRRNPRDGKYLENLGWYDPFLKGENVKVKPDRIEFWLKRGAILSERVKCLLAKAAPEVLKKPTKKA